MKVVDQYIQISSSSSSCMSALESMNYHKVRTKKKKGRQRRNDECLIKGIWWRVTRESFGHFLYLARCALVSVGQRQKQQQQPCRYFFILVLFVVMWQRGKSFFGFRRIPSSAQWADRYVIKRFFFPLLLFFGILYVCPCFLSIDFYANSKSWTVQSLLFFSLPLLPRDSRCAWKCRDLYIISYIFSLLMSHCRFTIFLLKLQVDCCITLNPVGNVRFRKNEGRNYLLSLHTQTILILFLRNKLKIINLCSFFFFLKKRDAIKRALPAET